MDAPRSPPRDSRARVIIGLDYGTCFTKVVYRRHDARSARAFVPGGMRDDVPLGVVPSRIRVDDDGHLWFGADGPPAAAIDHPSLKLHLVAPDHAPNMEDLTPGEIEAFVAAYLAWALHEVRHELDREYGEGGWTADVQVGAPMSHFAGTIQGAKRLRKLYTRVLATAYASAFGHGPRPPHNCEDSGAVIDRFQESLADRNAVPPPSERRFYVQPESLAPLVALMLEPTFDSGFYATVDVGGGTTDVLVVPIRDYRLHGEWRLPTFADDSIPVGGLHFAAASDASARTSELQDRLGQHIRRCAQTAWRQDHGARQKDAWRPLRVLRIGGGAAIPAVAKVVNDCQLWVDAFQDHRFLPEHVHLSWHRPSPQVLAGPRGAPPDQRNSFNLLSVALGLSKDPIQWPDWEPPEQAPFRLPQPQGRREDDDFVGKEQV